MDDIDDNSRAATTQPTTGGFHDGVYVKTFFLRDDEAWEKLSPDKDRRVFIECRSRKEHSDFDVVFVHALGRDRFDAWRCGDVFWPDYVVDDLPGARVLLFNYDTRVWHKPTIEIIQRVANDLAKVLRDARRGINSGRRIIWVAQSLAGFLVKAECILSAGVLDQQDISLGDIDDNLGKSTSGAIFIGTPHRALLPGGWRSVLQRIYEVTGERFHTSLAAGGPDALDNEEVIDFLAQFYRVIDKHQMRTFSFYEQHETPGTSLPIMITSLQNGLFHPSETQGTLPGNYLTMSQLQSRHDDSYKTLKSSLQTILDLDIPTSSPPTPLLPSSLEQSVVLAAQDILASNFHDRGVNQHRNALMSSLAVWQFASTLKLRRLERSLGALGPCAMSISHIIGQGSQDHIAGLLNSREFKAWGDLDSVLVIRGPNGSGKSTLVSHIIRSLRTKERGEDGTAYPRKCVLSYVFEDTLGSGNPVVHMLNRLLLQFLEIIPSLTRHFPTRRVFARTRSSWPEWDTEKAMKDGQNVEELQLKIDPGTPISESSQSLSYRDFSVAPFTILELVEIIISILHDDQVGNVFLVIDGLDDSPVRTRLQFQYFLDFLDSLQTKKIKVCLSCETTHILSCKEIIYLDIPGSQRRILGEDEDPKYILCAYYDANGVRRSTGEDLDELIGKIRAIRLQFHLALVTARQILKGLPSRNDIVAFVAYLEDFSQNAEYSENEKIDGLYEWIFEYLKKNACWKRIGRLFLAAAAARSLTILETSDLAPVEEKMASLYQERVMQKPTLKTDLNPAREDTNKAQGINTLDSDLFGFLRIIDGTLVIYHPSFRRFLLRKLNDHNLRFHVDYHIGVSCLKMMQDVGDTSQRAGHSRERQGHSVVIQKFSYPLQYWPEHLRAAHSSEQWSLPQSVEILSLLAALWGGIGTRGLVRETSRVMLPQATELPLSCLLAGCDLSKVLDVYYDEVKCERSPVDKHVTLDRQCATVNSRRSTLKVLEKHKQANKQNDQPSELLERYASWAGSRELVEQFFLLGWMFEPIDSGTTGERQWNGIRQMLKKPSELIRLRSEGHLDRLLLLAIRRCDRKFAIVLLDNGANRNYIDRDDPRRPSVLHLAAALGDADLVRELAHHRCRWSITDAFGMQPIHWAAERGHHNVVRILIAPTLDCEERFGQNPLFMACESSSLPTVQILLKIGSGANVPDDRQRMPIHIAAATGAIDVVRLLLSKGANVEAQDDEGIAPLHLAAFGGWTEIVYELLSAGASISTVTRAQRTPLHFACDSPNPSLAVALTLLQRRSSPYSEDSKGMTPLHVAIRNGSMALVELLLKVIPSPYDLTELFKLADGNDAMRQTLLKRQEYDLSLFQSSLEDRKQIDQMNDALVNVVFVHSYLDSAENTWSDESSKSAWPRKYLPKSEASARVFFWDHPYELTDFATLNSVYELGARLLEYVALTVYSTRTVSDLEMKGKREPLVFVSHSLGGLVVKAAITIAESTQEHHQLLADIKGTVFLGTPHQEMVLNSLNEGVRRLVQVAVNNLLEPWGDVLSSSQKSVDRSWRKRDMVDCKTLESEFEKACSVQPIKVLTFSDQVSEFVPRDCAYYAPSWAPSFRVNKHHNSLGKIDSTDDTVYKEILQFLLTIIREKKRSDDRLGDNQEPHTCPRCGFCF